MLKNDYIHYMHLEISSLCNAACPCCPRFNSTSPNPVTAQFLGYISFDNFIKWFPPEIMSKVRYLNFCGNHGDPGTNPDLPEILEYLTQFEFNKFQMHTNGGMKNPQFWDKVGNHLNNMKAKNVTFIFSIDGLEDTNHIYRRNVKWDRLIANVKEVTKYKNIHVLWDYLVFQHNEHQLDEAKKLSEELGFSDIEFKAPVNLDDGDNITPISVLDKDGGIMYWLEPTELKEFKPTYLPETAKKIYNKNTLWKEIINGDFGCVIESDGNAVKDANNSTIIPRCGHNDIYVDADGTVHPCCFVGLSYGAVKKTYDQGGYVSYSFRQMFDAQKEFGFDKFNLNTTSLQELIDSQLIQKLFNNKWEKSVAEGKMVACAQYCGKKNSLDNIYKLQREKEEVVRTVQV